MTEDAESLRGRIRELETENTKLRDLIFRIRQPQRSDLAEAGTFNQALQRSNYVFVWSHSVGAYIRSNKAEARRGFNEAKKKDPDLAKREFAPTNTGILLL